jgi:hypothetical protein
MSRVGSVAAVEHPLGEWSVFAGRRRFYWGPVFQNALGTQLLADRYSGAGVRTDQGRWAVEVAWLYDSLPTVDAQPGWLGAATWRGLGGSVLGLQLLEVPDGAPGHGRTVSFSTPVVRDEIEAYGEVGQGIVDDTLQTYGLYFPGLYQRTDTDLYLEYGHREGVGEVYSVVASRLVDDALEMRGYANWRAGDLLLGMGVIWRLGAQTSATAAAESGGGPREPVRPPQRPTRPPNAGF